MKINETNNIEVNNNLYIPVGNTSSNEAAHITMEQIKNFATTEVQQGLNYLGNKLDEIQVELGNTETWEFTLEDGSTITKLIVVK